MLKIERRRHRRAPAPMMCLEQRPDRMLYIVPTPTQPPAPDAPPQLEDPFATAAEESRRSMVIFTNLVIYGAGIASAVLLYFILRGA